MSNEQKKYKFRFYQTGFYGHTDIEINEPNEELAIAMYEARFPNDTWRFVEQVKEAAKGGLHLSARCR